jgi:hypothetical protein
MVLVKMLMEIDPLSMRGSLVMTMASISPSQREVSLAEQLRRSPRLVLPWFRLETAALHPERFLLILPVQNTPYSRRWAWGACLVDHTAGWRALVGSGCPGPLPVPTFWYIRSFDLEKIKRGLSGWSAAVSRWNLGRSTFALRRSDSTGGTSLPEGEIEAIVITNNPLIFGRPIFINIFNSTISSQTLVHLLCSIFVSKPQSVYSVEDHIFRSIMIFITPLILSMNMLCE